MELYYKITGVLLMVLALAHAAFPKHFEWKKDLSSLSLINRQMMLVHTFFIALTVFLMGLLCLLSADELINTDFGKKISLGLGVFWGARLLIQFFWYSPKLWKGKTFETIVHIVFSILWISLTTLFFTAYFA